MLPALLLMMGVLAVLLRSGAATINSDCQKVVDSPFADLVPEDAKQIVNPNFLSTIEAECCQWIDSLLTLSTYKQVENWGKGLGKCQNSTVPLDARKCPTCFSEAATGMPDPVEQTTASVSATTSGSAPLLLSLSSGAATLAALLC